ncbi:MAG: efflux RND transporter periplasmic adaptor subunit [Acidobacteriota bacterium]
MTLPPPDVSPAAPSVAAWRRVLATYGRYFAVAITLALAALLMLSDANAVDGSESTATRKTVLTAEVRATDAARTLRFSGVTRAARRAALPFTVRGRLAKRPVEIGDRVRAGDLLAQLDDRERVNAVTAADAQLAELRARRDQATRDWDRAKQLMARRAATSEEVERTRAGLDALDAAVSAAETRLREEERLLDEARLRAPFDGVVTAVSAEPGEYVNTGQSVVTLSGAGAVEVEVEVPERVIPQIGAVGSRVEVELPAFERTVAGRVTARGEAGRGAGALFPVIIALDGADADAGRFAPLPGLTAELVLALRNPDALAVPVVAVINPGSRQPLVYRVVDERVERVSVDIGPLQGSYVAVTPIAGALQPGDAVVVGGQRGLLDGDAVSSRPLDDAAVEAAADRLTLAPRPAEVR